MNFVTAKDVTIKTEKRLGTGMTIPLSFYITPPQEELTLDEFELLSLDRLQFLRSLEVMKARGFEEKEINSKLSEV